MKDLFRSKLFWLGLGLKLIFLGFLGSTYLRELFVPFLDRAVLNPTANPWSLSPPEYFPYGTALYAILFIPRFVAFHILGPMALGSGFLGLVLIKGPLLFFDFLLLNILWRISEINRRKLLWYYWLNPILFYISYIHGQLDVVAMSFCVLSLWLLVRERPAWSGVAMAASVLCKFHTVLVIPFLLVFIWNREFLSSSLRSIAKWLGAFVSISALGFLPLIFAHRIMYASAQSPEALRIFSLKIETGMGGPLYIGILMVLALMGRLCLSTRISSRGFLLGCGALFGSLLLVTFPAPGWYFWFMPFLALLFSLYNNVPWQLFWLVNLSYFFHFLVAPELQFIPFVSSLGLTVLQTSLFGTLLALVLLVLPVECPIGGRSRPVLLGIAGDSGAGKNHLSQVLQDVFNSRTTLLVEGDDYHKWERGDENWKTFTHLNPNANHLPALLKHAKHLTQGLPIFQPHYDHGTGRFTEAREQSASKTVILQGLHTLYVKGLREQLDLKIFLAPDERVRLAWKLARDTKERGYSIEKLKAQIEKRRSDAETHINPQKVFADWLIEYLPEGDVSLEQIFAGFTPKIAVKHTLWNDTAIGEIVEGLSQSKECEISLSDAAGDISRISLLLTGAPSAQTIERVGLSAFPYLRQITRSRRAPLWQPGLDGLNQLLLLTFLNAKRS